MFCNACGKPNPEGSTLCASCGKPIIVAEEIQSMQKPESQPHSEADKLEESKRKFCISWRELARSPLFLILTIFQTITLLPACCNIGTTMLLSNSTQILTLVTNPIFIILAAVLYILLSFPNYLIVAGLWLVYISAWDKSDGPVNVLGLRIIKVSQQIYIIAAAICVLCAPIVASIVWRIMSLQSSNGFAVAAGIVIGTFAAGATVISISAFIIKVLDSVICGAEHREPNSDYMLVFAVAEFIVGGISVCSGLAAMCISFSLSGMAGCVVPFLAGAAALKYRKKMDILRYERYHNG